MSMCISNTGFEKDCVWEPYNPTKNWNISDTLDGKDHYVFVTLRDQAGNKTNIQSKPYQVYLECSKTTKGYTSSWGSCSASCGGGVQYRPYQVKDNHTGKVCSSGSDQQSCNTHSCSILSSYNERMVAGSFCYEETDSIYVGSGSYKIRVWGEITPWTYAYKGDPDKERYSSAGLYLRYSKNDEKSWSGTIVDMVYSNMVKYFDKTFTLSTKDYLFIQFRYGKNSDKCSEDILNNLMIWGNTYVNNYVEFNYEVYEN